MAERLRTENITVSFQGLRALEGVNLSLSRGEILGLLGPNGAGKTTLVNVLSGFQRPTTGRVLLDEQDVTGKTPEALATRGVSRTFQSVRLFKKLSVRENVNVGALAMHSSRRAARSPVDDILEMTGLASYANRQAGALPYAIERLVGIARALALRPHFLLLDEPAAGMSDAECTELVTLIVRLPTLFKCGILLIEHNMSVVMRACARLHVLDSGRTLTVGETEPVRRDPIVINAYLGSA
jgi:branched-chain amino acid transport system ATP-binding protein